MHHRSSSTSKVSALFIGLFLVITLAVQAKAGAETLRCEFATRHAADFSLSFALVGSGEKRQLFVEIHDRGMRISLAPHGTMQGDNFYSKTIEGLWFTLQPESPDGQLASLQIVNPKLMEYFEGFAASVDAQVMPDKPISGYPLSRVQQESDGELIETITARRGIALDFQIEFSSKADHPRSLTNIGFFNRKCDRQ